MTFQHFDEAAVEAATPYPALIEAIGDAFREGGASPARHSYNIPTASGTDGTLLLMPSWGDTGSFGVKLATVYPTNATRELPTVNGTYVLFDRDTGLPQATFDATALTARRTAAASAFAASKLARADAETMLIVGTGRLSHCLIEAHCTVRNIRKIRIWGRSTAKATTVADVARANSVTDVDAVSDLEAACREADIVSTATSSSKALVRGNWLKPGAHVDLVGAFTPDMREADADVFRRAGVVYVDTFEGAKSEAGDIIAAIDEGALRWDDVSGDLYELARTASSVRQASDDISVFKSVGTGLEDLAAARLCCIKT